jgi:hypothetical protein
MPSYQSNTLLCVPSCLLNTCLMVYLVCFVPHQVHDACINAKNRVLQCVRIGVV